MTEKEFYRKANRVKIFASPTTAFFIIYLLIAYYIQPHHDKVAESMGIGMVITIFDMLIVGNRLKGSFVINWLFLYPVVMYLVHRFFF